MRSLPADGASLLGAVPDALRGAPATRIANARGVPGTLGCLALTLHERRLVLVTSHHVLFGAGAPERAPVWLLGDGAAVHAPRRLGTALWGRRGTVAHGAADVHVDCAVAELDHGLDVDAMVDEVASLARLGETVRMTGAASGAVEGMIADVAYSAIARVDGRERPAPGQLLVRRRGRGAFATAGDSGAVLRVANDAIVGLLWGVTAAGDGVACPIAPALRVLHVRAVRVEGAAVAR